MRCAVVSINVNGVEVIVNESDYDSVTMVLWGDQVLVPSVPAMPPVAPSMPAMPPVAPSMPPVAPSIPVMAPIMDHRLQR